MVLLPLLAQAAAVAAAPAAAPPPSEGVISYPASFFAGQQVANANEMLGRVPGFTLDSGSSVRGYEGAAGNVLVDGQRPASKSDDLEEILRRIPASQVERIDIIRGGAPGIDMQGKSVLANVIRKKGGGFRGLFAVANSHLWDGRNMHGMRLELGGGDGVRTWEATARYGYGNDDGGEFGPQYRILPDGTIVRRSQVKSESDGNQETLTAGYSQPLLGGRIALNGRAFWNKWKFEDTNRYIEPPELGTVNEFDPSHDFDTEVSARFNRDLGSRTKLEALVLRTDKDNESDSYFRAQGDLSEFHNDRTLSETIGRAVLKHQLSDRLSFEAGGEGAFNALDSHTRVLENGALIPLPAANVQVEEARGEAFLKSSWRPSAKWTLEGDLRYERSRITSDGDVVLEKTLGFLKPRVALTWSPASATQVRLRLEREVGQLDFDDFVASSNFNLGTGVSAGNPDLNPEQAWVFEAALEQRFWKSGAAVVTYRHSKLTDVVDRGPVFLDDGTVFDQPTNIGDGTKDELEISLTVPSDPLGWKGGLLNAGLNRRWSEVTDPTTHTSRPISSLRPLEWNVQFTQDLPSRGLSFGAYVYSGWSQVSYRFDYISEVKLHNAYAGVWLEKRLDPTVTVRLEAENVFGRGIRFATHFYDGPRDTSPLLFTDDRDLIPGPTYYVRVRKTFGG
jgi:outer membrane receptor protein involved in Fe transport